MNKKFLKFVFFCFISVCFLGVLFRPVRRVEVFFSPSFDCESNIIDAISNTEKTLDIAVFSMTNRTILNALLKAHERGVLIRFLGDRTMELNKYSVFPKLKEAGISFRFNDAFELEHNKFAIYDDDVVLTGSYNWTRSASSSNSENCIFLHNDKKVVRRYKERFDYLWKLNDDPAVKLHAEIINQDK